MAKPVVVVLNTGYGGFCLSKSAMSELRKKGWHGSESLELTVDARTDPLLVEVCRKLGRHASTDREPFELVEVSPEDLPFVVLTEYDGAESLEILQSAKDHARELADELLSLRTMLLAANTVLALNGIQSQIKVDTVKQLLGAIK